MNTKKENKRRYVYKIVVAVILTAIVTALVTSTLEYKNFEKMLKERNLYFSTNGETFFDASLKSGVSNEKDATFEERMNYLENKILEFKSLFTNQALGEIDDEKMIEYAIKGYVLGLDDKYVEYYTKEEMDKQMEDTESTFVGIGVYVYQDVDTNTIQIAGTFEESDAREKGLEIGDIILAINDKPYSGDQLDEAIKNMKGEAGTKVKITIQRNDQVLEFEIERRKIIVPHVASKMLDNYPNIGYIQIDSFDMTVDEQFKKELDNLISNNDVKGLIIDIRSNGGGVVDIAANIADYFIPKDSKIYSVKSKDNKEKTTTAQLDVIYNMPVVIMTNQYTASASELMTAAIRENKEDCRVVGKTTYGKGVIQSLLRLVDGSGIKYTSEEYYTSKGNSINEVGIKPDVDVDLTKDKDGKYQIEESTDAQLKAAVTTLTRMIDD